MQLRPLAAAAFALAALVAPSPAIAGSAQVRIKEYKNCTALNRVYPHGVGKTGAVDKVSHHSQKVRNFYVSDALYAKTKKCDRDKDKIACEKL